jgi:hypothetical protein
LPNRFINLSLIFFIFFIHNIYGQKKSSEDKHFRKIYKENLHEVLQNKLHGYKPPKGVVSDSLTAVKISETILSKIYGEEQIRNEKPFTALLIEGYWIIFGYLPQGYKGGVAVIFIKKSNGEVIYISHGE